MDPQEEIVAIGLLTRRDVDHLSATLKNVFLLDQKLMFLDLLQALDEVDARSVQIQGDAPS